MRWRFALGLLPLAACSAVPPPPALPTERTPALSAQDQRFVRVAGATDLFEIRSSQLAMRSRDASVRRFAARMVQDHTRTTQQLDALLNAKGLTPAPALGAEQQQTMGKLEAHGGATFIGNYRTAQIEGHQTAVQAFQQEVEDGYDADIRGFARQTLPLLRQHLTMAQGMR